MSRAEPHGETLCFRPVHIALETDMNAPAMLWAGRILTGLFALFMLGASTTPKRLQPPIAEETLARLG